MPLPRVTNALRLRRAAVHSPVLYQPARCLSTTLPRRVAMADGGKAVDDIDLAFDYPSEMQATYTTPSGVHQTRLDKEMGYPDQRVLYGFFFLSVCLPSVSLSGWLADVVYPTTYLPWALPPIFLLPLLTEVE